MVLYSFFFFFFKQKTAYEMRISDWRSDVCSSDLYGHRRKGDCMDIESLVALGPLDRDTMIKQIEGLNAIGMTPLTASVKQAIEQLRQTEQSASVVLVSDGLESCGGDPCEAVRAARQSGVDF